MSTNTKLAEALRRLIGASMVAMTDQELATGETLSAWEDANEALAAHDAEQAAQAVPAGFKWVPVEPTEDMLTAAGREDDKAFVDGMPHGATAADVWAVMLAAAAPAPQAPAAGHELADLFESWWSKHGQFCRAGGGDYEKSFAWAAWNAALAQRQPLTDEDWRTRDSSDTDEGCAALHRAHGIGATTGEQQR